MWWYINQSVGDNYDYIVQAVTSPQIKSKLLQQITTYFAWSTFRDLSATPEDIFQEVCVRALKNTEKFAEGSNVEAWLYTMTYRICHDVYRKWTRWKDQPNCKSTITNEVTDPFVLLGNIFDPLDSDPLEYAERRVILRKIIDTLPDEQKQVVELRIYEDMPFEEIASLLSINESTARWRSRRGLINMRKNPYFSWGDPIFRALWNDATPVIEEKNFSPHIDQLYIYSFYEVMWWNEKCNEQIITHIDNFVVYLAWINSEVNACAEFTACVEKFMERKNTRQYSRIFTAIKEKTPLYRIELTNTGFLAK